MSSETTTETATAGITRRQANLKPWQPRQSGNPSGISKRQREHAAQLRAQFIAELGDLTPAESFWLDRAIELLMLRPKLPSDKVKLTSEARRIFERLRADRTPRKAESEPPAPPTLLELRQRHGLT